MGRIKNIFIKRLGFDTGSAKRIFKFLEACYNVMLLQRIQLYATKIQWLHGNVIAPGAAVPSLYAVSYQTEICSHYTSEYISTPHASVSSNSKVRVADTYSL
jgi:hypothetical protein